MKFRKTALLPPAILLSALALAWPGTATAAETPLARIEGAAKNLQAQTKNASMKLKYTVRSDSRAGTGLRSVDERPKVTSPVLECCSRNIAIMDDRLETIAVAVRDLYERHQKADEQQAVAAVTHMAETYRAVQKAVVAFGEADEVPFAKIHLDELSSELNHFVRDIDKYRVAIGEAPAAAESVSDSAEPPAQDNPKKKKRKKKSGSASGDATAPR